MHRRILTVCGIALALASGAGWSAFSDRGDDDAPPPITETDKPPVEIGADAATGSREQSPNGNPAKKKPAAKSLLGGFGDAVGRMSAQKKTAGSSQPKPAPATRGGVGVPANSDEPARTPAAESGTISMHDDEPADSPPKFDPDEPTRDSDVERVQSSAPMPGGGGSDNPLPPAREPQGDAAAPQGTGASSDPILLPADSVPAGPNTTGVTVEARAPATANLSLPTWVQIIVKNTSDSPAMGVKVYYPLPEGLEFLDAQPAQTLRAGHVFVWQLNTMQPGTQKAIKVRLKALKAIDVAHAPTVTVSTGSKAKTRIQQPLLKVELHASESKILRGKSVQFDVTVTNAGNGPARDVEVRANLTSGLKYGEEGPAIKLVLKETGKSGLAPGESLALDPLIVDATSGGEQTCSVQVSSPDVPAGLADAQKVVRVTVVEPKLKLAIKGPSERYPDSIGTYTVSVVNLGTAPGQHVKVGAKVPIEGTPTDFGGGQWYADQRWVVWSVPELEPNRPMEFKFQVRMGGIGRLPVKSQLKADGGISTIDEIVTQITGMADVKCLVTESRRILDVGEDTIYEIKLRNRGSREALNIQVMAETPEQLEIVETAGTDSEARSTTKDHRRNAIFPTIARLAPNESLDLTVRVKAVKAGSAYCKVTVQHDDFAPRTYTEPTKVAQAPTDAVRQ